MADGEEADTSHIKLHQISSFPQGSLVSGKGSYQPKVVVASGGPSPVIVSSATTHLQTTSTQVSRVSTLPIQAGPAASYHVPRGAAAVANMAVPRSSVATPVLRGPPTSLPIGGRAVLPTGVQTPTPRQSAKIPTHHVGSMRGRGVTVGSKQHQQVVGGRLLGPTLVAAARPPHSTIITSTVLTKPVMLSSSSGVRGPLQGQSSAKIYQQPDQSSTAKIFQPADQAKHYQTDQSTTTKLYQQPDQQTSVKIFQQGDQQTTTKLYHQADQTSAKIYAQTDQASSQTQQPSQPIYIHHKPHIGASSQTHSTVVVPHGSVVQQQQHGTVVQTHGTVVQQQATVVQPPHSAIMTSHIAMSQQHGSILQQHVPQTHGPVQAQQHCTVLQPQHSGTLQQHGMVQTHQHTQAHTSVSHGQQHNMMTQQSHGTSMQAGCQASYIEISRQMVRPPSHPASTVHQQSSSCQVMRFNPVVVVEAGRAQTFPAGLLSSASSGVVAVAPSDSATLTALPPGIAPSMVQPQNIAIQQGSVVSASSQHAAVLTAAQQQAITASVAQTLASGMSLVAPVASSSATGAQMQLTPQCLAAGVAQSLASSISQSLTPKQNTSPRPSILRKRDPDNWSGGLKAQRNLGPVLSGLNVTPLGHHTQVDEDAPPGSGGSSTLSAASSPDQAPQEQPPPPVPTVLEHQHHQVPTTSTSSSLSSSPRKKPRKQQLPHNPPPSRPSPFSDEDMQFLSDKPQSNSKSDYCVEDEKRKRMSLLKSYKQGWKPTQNHFVRYGDVRTKEEKKPTLTELANQKNALNIINGWKIYHLLSQIEDMVNTETEYYDLFTSLLTTMEEKQQKIKNKNPDKKTDELLNRLNERVKANAQRCKVVNDHMQEARGQFMKLFEHKGRVADLINRFANKRALKKRERL